MWRDMLTRVRSDAGLAQGRARNLGNSDDEASVFFSFENRQVKARVGQSVAAALLASSAQLIVMGMTAYAMPPHLAFNLADDLERALRDGQRGDLRLYAQEATSFEWDQEALRLIGNAQFRLRSFAGAREIAFFPPMTGG